jgi:uncharacterized glyoxalase superfamily protein PhnB
MLPSELDVHQLHGIQPVLQVADVAAAIAHYTKLGFALDFIAGDPPVMARVSSGDRTSAGAARVRFAPVGTVGARVDRGYYWVHVGHDLDGLFAKLAARGVDVVSPPTTQPWGLRDFRIRDPDGNLFLYAGYL